MNGLIRGVRFSMRIDSTNCVKGVLEPKADSTDTNDLLYAGDADPDRVHRSLTPPTTFCFFSSKMLMRRYRSQMRKSSNSFMPTAPQHFTPYVAAFPSSIFYVRSHYICLFFFFADVDRAHQRLFRDLFRDGSPRSAPSVWASKTSASSMLPFSRTSSAGTPLPPKRRHY
jgi:hypothetical protein